jgi:hypothetical protein
MSRHILGREATYMAIVQIEPLPADGAASVPPTTTGSAAPALAPAGASSVIAMQET